VIVAEMLLWPLKLTPAARFPQNRAPNHQIFTSLVSSVRERGTFQQNTKSFINPTVTHDVNQARLLNLVKNNPDIVAETVALELGSAKVVCFEF
jgi:hypothetical protein